MADLATLQARLSEAETALHALTIGARAQTVTSDSGSVTYTPATLGGLQAYVMSLRAQIAAASGRPLRRHWLPGFGR